MEKDLATLPTSRTVTRKLSFIDNDHNHHHIIEHADGSITYNMFDKHRDITINMNTLCALDLARICLNTDKATQVVAAK